MKVFSSNALIDQLQADIREVLASATRFRSMDPEVLITQPEAGRWSAVQALEHLNTYGRYYIPALGRALEEPKPAKVSFKSGWLGNYFTKMMAPQDGQVKNKMSAPKGYRPPITVDSKPVIDEFIAQQQQLLALLEKARNKDLGSTRVPTSLTKMIKMKLGDTFRFLIAHEQRHLIQAQKAIAVIESIQGKYPTALQGA